MTKPELILSAIVSSFVKSAERDSFNGIIAESLLRFDDSVERLRSHLSVLIEKGKISCVFASTNVNMHIKRFPDFPVDKQQSLLEDEKLDAFCVYPAGPEISRVIDVTQWNDRPFSKLLVLAEPQLAYRAFDMSVLERYTADPRYTFEFEDYMGRISVGDVSFNDEDFPNRDKVWLQTFGLGFNPQHIPHVIVYLRYLASLSPEHQQYWNSYLASNDVPMCEQYYKSSILGEFWKNRSIRYAIIEEIKLINAMSECIWGCQLFRTPPTGSVPIGLSSFLRPTADNYHRFVMSLDKLLSDSIRIKFFDGKIPLEDEVVRADGKLEVRRKGSLRLLEEWLLSEISWEDSEMFRKVVMSPLREVRELRQTPAHKFTTDHFSKKFYENRKKLLWDIFNSLRNIRSTFAKHPSVSDLNTPAWLDDEEIDVF